MLQSEYNDDQLENSEEEYDDEEGDDDEDDEDRYITDISKRKEKRRYVKTTGDLL